MYQYVFAFFTWIVRLYAFDKQLRQSDFLFLLTSQFIKLLVLVDNLNSTNYPLQIKDPGAFVICGFRSYILTLLSLFYTCLYINEIIIYTSVPVFALIHRLHSYLFASPSALMLLFFYWPSFCLSVFPATYAVFQKLYILLY